MMSAILAGIDETENLFSGNNDFYCVLPALNMREDMVDTLTHHKVPADWFVVVADIKGSTQAIADGRYKAVNMTSAATITAALNAIRRETGRQTHDIIPYVFGGDGATLLVPPSLMRAVVQALEGTRRMAHEAQGLQMRAGAVRIAALEGMGAGVNVAKIRVSNGLVQAVLSGAGIGLTEKLVKDGETAGIYDIAALFDRHVLMQNPPDFSGLSCRWAPLRNDKGLTLSLIVLARAEAGDTTQTYRGVMAGIAAICGQPENWRPATANNMRLSLSSTGLGLETSIATVGLSPAAKAKFYGTAWFKTLLGKLSFLTGCSFGTFNARRYSQSVIQHTDYLKFDNALRMVMDISLAQKEELNAMLEGMHADGTVYYGTHTADAALMTCLVFDYGQEHFHFIDGADGGYALAALQMKAQVKIAPQTR